MQQGSIYSRPRVKNWHFSNSPAWRWSSRIKKEPHMCISLISVAKYLRIHSDNKFFSKIFWGGGGGGVGIPGSMILWEICLKIID